jgi:hypothetical protein
VDVPPVSGGRVAVTTSPQVHDDPCAYLPAGVECPACLGFGGMHRNSGRPGMPGDDAGTGTVIVCPVCGGNGQIAPDYHRHHEPSAAPGDRGR